MKLALIGATGRVGSRILPEALARNHQVSALTQDLCDIYQADQVASACAGHDAVISAFSPPLDAPDLAALFVAGTRSLLDGVRRSRVKRLLVVGGASNLENEAGVLMLETPEFPEPWRPSARAGLEAKKLVASANDLDWTYISPALNLTPGERTGQYVSGLDRLLRNGRGESAISFEDLAVAVLDEIETPRHVRQRFTVAYG